MFFFINFNRGQPKLWHQRHNKYIAKMGIVDIFTYIQNIQQSFPNFLASNICLILEKA